MKNRTTSVLGSAALVMVVVGLALWVVSQLTDSGAAAERLQLITVGASESSTQEGALGAEGADSTGSVGPSPETTTVSRAEESGGRGTQATTSPTTTAIAGPWAGSTTTTTRIVVPDPVREHERGHSGPGSEGATSPGGFTGDAEANPSGPGGSDGSGTAAGSGTAGR